jgi:tetratricopeptide (TPR) repeat protein
LGLGLLGVVLAAMALGVRLRTDPTRFRQVPRVQLEAWVADHPDDGDALYELGRRYRQEGQVTDARRTLERARRLQPGNARLLNDLGELAAGQGDYVTAQALFEQAAALRPDLPEPHRNLGNLAGIARNYVLAIQHYQKALARRPADVETLAAMGAAYADARNRGQAVATFRKAIALQPDSAALYQGLGLALTKFQDYAGARAALEQALARDPNDPHTHLFLGLAFAHRLRTAEEEQKALEHFDRAAALGYTGAEDDYGRGLVYLRRKEYSKAIPALAAATRQEGGGEDARYQLARAYLAAGQTARGEAAMRGFERLKETREAVRRLRHQLATEPGDAATRRRLADLCLDTGRYREALQQYRLLRTAGAADAGLFQGIVRAAEATGEALLAEQARAALRAIESTKNTKGHERT